MLRKIHHSVVLLTGLLLPGVVAAQLPFTVIQQRIAANLLSGGKTEALAVQAGRFLLAAQPDGSWPDIDYTNGDITNWQPARHLERIMSLSKAYVQPGNQWQGQALMQQAIMQGLRCWYSKNASSKNWWHNDINAPQLLGEIMLLLNTRLPATLQDSLVQRMTRGNIFKQTGANKVDVALHYIYRACITKNNLLMDTAVQQAFEPIAFVKGEGLQCDYSYLQHGPQLHISSYGLVFLLGEYKIASYLAATPYALPAEKLAMLNRYFTGTFLRTIRGSYIDFNVEGRAVSRPGCLDKKSLAVNNADYSIHSLFQMVKASASGKSSDANIEEVLARISGQQPATYQVQPYHACFWRGDYTMHVRAAFSFNVRTVSVRTRRTESGNGENLLSRFMADGATNIQRRGEEYYNIMPVWEWDKIPGTTGRDYATDQLASGQWGEQGSTAFVGGVSDSLYGVSAYDMNYNDVKAKKAWFFLDSAVVCVGAGITSTAAEEVVTTVNQCWVNGKVQRSDKSASQQWIWHDSTGYFFPQAGNIHVNTQVQKGSWKRINKSYSDKEVKGDVFSLWVTHGHQPANSSYAYIVVPGLMNEKAMQAFPVKAIQLLANTDSIQAVSYPSRGMLQVVFYQPGTICANGYALTVDKPCIVMLHSQAGKIKGSVADPTQQLQQLTIQLSTPFTKAPVTKTCQLPAGEHAGATLAFDL